ncbi:TonB-dependent receptor [Bradymonas sediminis]|uniref:Uncharacterized protein n=1 Tax=Bradymonas sediminis TaxID=1548548 RepID=A0A2Z4FI40_9DELT|nr:TonB-dependent receptor [Bradymonas sediminis]AWV88579.1 hypothetical protein DN745_04195 [Bradymonas sediminis]TDP77723.1 outer membrane receptor protein involved in Fe transport [Bradymonas sediminis]
MISPLTAQATTAAKLSFAAVVCLWLTTPLLAYAQTTAAISGRVVEAELDDYGVPGAEVRVDGRGLATSTDDSGHFYLDALPDGPLTLSVTAPDYHPIQVTIAGDERQAPLLIELTWAGADVVAVTTTTAAPAPQTASSTQISAREIAASPHRNAEELLRQVPGLTLVQHGSEGKGHQFFMRGFDAIHGADLEITLDGIPLNEWSNIHAQGYLDLGIIIPEVIRNVSVTKGPFTLNQGLFAMAGSADYQLGVPTQDRGWRATYSIGSTNRHRVFAGYSPIDGRGEQFVGVEATHDDSFGQNRSIDRATVNAKTRLPGSTDSHYLDLIALGGYANFDLPGALRNDDVNAGRVGFYDTYDPLGEGSSARALLALNYQRDALSINTYAAYRRLELLENFTGYLIDPVNSDRRAQFQDTYSFGLLANHRAQLLDQLAIATGVGARADLFAQHEDNVDDSLETVARRRDLEGVQLNAHALAGLQWQPHHALQLNTGARLDLVHFDLRDHLADTPQSDDQLLAVSPRLTARWQAREFWQLFAAYGRGLRSPEARAFSTFKPAQSGIGDEIYDGGDPANTVSDAFELGTRWNPKDWFGLSLAGFATFIERESIFDHVSGVNLELNGTRRLGAELVLYSDPLSWLSLRADITYVDARFTESGNPVPLAPWLTAGARAIATHPSGFRAGLRALAVAPRTLPHGATGATLLMTDLTVGYHWDWLRLDLEVENLLNQRLREGEYHYASHWQPGAPASEIPVLTTTAGPPLNARLTLSLYF